MVISHYKIHLWRLFKGYNMMDFHEGLLKRVPKFVFPVGSIEL